MNLENKKLIVAAIFLVLLAGFIAPHSASAAATTAATSTNPVLQNDNVSLLDCLNSTVSCALYFISYVVGAITGWLIGLGSFLTLLALSFSQTLLDSPAVKVGFSVTLAIANLGFVLAIIVIAIATIVRSQTYGVKQLLWKLVVAAIFVNFSLVIAGALLGFSDSLTNFFMKPFPGSDSAQAVKIGNNRAFVDRLTAGFAPQQLQYKGATSTLSSVAADWGNRITRAGIGCATGSLILPFPLVGCVSGVALAKLTQPGANTDQGDHFFRDLLNLIFIIIFDLVIAFMFVALAVMLIIRYVWLGFLLILMPLVWLLWIFPSFKSHWDKWWSNFIRWTFFAPAVVFFLYLALAVAQNRSDYLSKYANDAATSGPGTFLGLMTEQTGGFVQSVGETIMMVGLALGGLFAANALSITGASVAMGLAKSAGGAVQGYATKQGRRGAKVAYEKARLPGLRENLQKGEVSRFIPKRLQSMMGRGMSKLERAGGASLVEEERKWASQYKDPEEISNMLAGSLPTEKRLALIARMNESGDLSRIKNIGGKDKGEFLGDEKTFRSYGQGKLYGDIKKSTGGQYDPTNRAAAEAVRNNGDGATLKTEEVLRMDPKNELALEAKNNMVATVRASEILKTNMEKLASTLDRKNVRDMDVNAMFGNDAMKDPKTKELREAFLKSIATEAPHLVSAMVSNPSMKSTQLKNFSGEYVQTLNSLGATLNKEIDASRAAPDEKKKRKLEAAQQLIDLKDNFKKSLVNNSLGFTSGLDSGTAALPAAPPPAPPTP